MIFLLIQKTKEQNFSLVRYFNLSTQILMRIYISLVIFVIFTLSSNVYSHVQHYKNLKFLKYGLYFNDKFIGNHTFKFEQKGEFLYVYGTGNFNVNKLGVTLFDFKTVSEEVFNKNKLVKYTSKTIQNEKEKFSNVQAKKNKLLIDGSSFKGEAEKDLLVGTWWNHEIIKFSKQISPISGRLLPQKVTFLGKKDVKINNRSYKTLHFNFLSDDELPIDKKKLNINIYYDEKSLLWLKSSYQKFGEWEYRLIEAQ